MNQNESTQNLENDSEKRKSKIGLVLGGGGVRACFHIGFYEILKQNNIPIDFVAGTSMGAIIGGAIALDFPVEKMKELMLNMKNEDMITMKNFNYFNESLLKNSLIVDNLNDVYGDLQFSDTKIKFACTAVNLESGREVVLTEGKLATAIAASSAFPAIFPPVFHNEQYLVDGGIISNVPMLSARKMGADKLIAVSIKNLKVKQYISGQIFMRHYKKIDKESWFKRKIHFFRNKKNDVNLFIDILLGSISIASERSAEIELREAKPDVFVEEIVDIDLFEFSKIDEAIEMGRVAGKKYLPQIKAMLEGDDN